MKFKEVLLEEWMRHYYFSVEVDIGSSGVQNFSMAELRDLTGFSHEDIDRVVLRDSESFGGANVRQALADRWLGGRGDHVLVTHGSSEALYLVMTSLLSPGDEVVVLFPAIPSTPRSPAPWDAASVTGRCVSSGVFSRISRTPGGSSAPGPAWW